MSHRNLRRDARCVLVRRALTACCSLAACAQLACKQAPPPAPEVLLATDLPAATVDQILRSISDQGGPRAARVAGQRLGAGVLPPKVAATDSGARAKDAAAAESPSAAPASSAASVQGAPASGTKAAAAEAPPAAANAQGASAGAPGAPAGDVRWDLEPYGAIAAAARGELLPLPASAEDVPDLWRDPGGRWVAVGGRAQVLLVALDRLGEHPAPVRLTALVEPWLKDKVAMVAPTGGAALAHFAALYEAWGEERMQGWLSQLRGNGVQLLPDDAAVRLAVVQGRAIVGLLGSDEAAKAKASAAPVEVVYPNQRSIGTFVWPTALSRPRNAAHPDAAARLAERLGDRLTEQLLVAREPGFLPLRRDIPVPPGVRSAVNLVVISVSPARIVAQIALRREALASWAREAQARAQQP